jgi:hypothetical protein
MNHPFRPVVDGDGECAICHNGIGSTVHAEGREGVERMSLEDLRVHVRPPYEQTRLTWRPATREDVLAAVRELGGVEVETWQRGDGYWAISPPEDSPGRYLIVPLDTGDTE